MGVAVLKSKTPQADVQEMHIVPPAKTVVDASTATAEEPVGCVRGGKPKKSGGTYGKSRKKPSAGTCQALTKKGTQCSRKSRSGGYCWQHGG